MRKFDENYGIVYRHQYGYALVCPVFPVRMTGISCSDAQKQPLLLSVFTSNTTGHTYRTSDFRPLPQLPASDSNKKGHTLFLFLYMKFLYGKCAPSRSVSFFNPFSPNSSGHGSYFWYPSAVLPPITRDILPSHRVLSLYLPPTAKDMIPFFRLSAPEFPLIFPVSRSDIPRFSCGLYCSRTPPTTGHIPQTN